MRFGHAAAAPQLRRRGLHAQVLSSRPSSLFTPSHLFLRLHIGLGAGKIGLVHVGGEVSLDEKRVEFLITGEPLAQVSACEHAALPGEVPSSLSQFNVALCHRCLGIYFSLRCELDLRAAALR